MIQNVIKGWPLLAVCGVIEALYSSMNFFMRDADGSLALRTLVHRPTLVNMGLLALAAGACAILAAVWSSRKEGSWLLALNGLACSALGLILSFWKGPLAFTVVALLIIAMAMSLALYLWASARASHRKPGEWLLVLAGVASIGYSLAFLAFVFRWMELDPGSPAQSLHWLGSYFGFSALCKLGLALYRSRHLPTSGLGHRLSPFLAT